jgi:hypothetical protein
MLSPTGGGLLTPHPRFADFPPRRIADHFLEDPLPMEYAITTLNAITIALNLDGKIKAQ